MQNTLLIRLEINPSKVFWDTVLLLTLLAAATFSLLLMDYSLDEYKLYGVLFVAALVLNLLRGHAPAVLILFSFIGMFAGIIFPEMRLAPVMTAATMVQFLAFGFVELSPWRERQLAERQAKS